MTRWGDGQRPSWRQQWCFTKSCRRRPKERRAGRIYLADNRAAVIAGEQGCGSSCRVISHRSFRFEQQDRAIRRKFISRRCACHSTTDYKEIIDHGDYPLWAQAQYNCMFSLQSAHSSSIARKTLFIDSMKVILLTLPICREVSMPKIILRTPKQGGTCCAKSKMLHGGLNAN